MKKPKLTIHEVEEAICLLEYWEQNCHGASLARTGAFRPLFLERPL